MKIFKIIILGTLILFTTQACQSKKIASTQIEISGVIKKQGMTTYQYGTHTLTIDGKQYALKSNTLDLNKYLKQNVTLIGEKIAGYPIEGGPDYIEVIRIK